MAMSELVFHIGAANVTMRSALVTDIARRVTIVTLLRVWRQPRPAATAVVAEVDRRCWRIYC